MEILTHVFGGKTRVRILRLFLLNPDKIFDARTVLESSRGKPREVERELPAFEKIGLIKRRKYIPEGGKRKSTPLVGWALNNSFQYLQELRGLLLNDVLVRGYDLVKRLHKTGSLKLVALAGVFIQNWESRIDILIVGDKLKRGMIERLIRSVESEIGRELRYAVLDSSDFQYRMSIGDKLVRDVIDFPHQIALDKLGIGKK